ncbi:hypothetical protein N0Y54_01835 [Nostoc punctiforme UO1]|uniref:hypothetical protein n=1 Tax=Nostoc punctiforme TaxID=272131 RepID=UPI0030AFAFCA
MSIPAECLRFQRFRHEELDKIFSSLVDFQEQNPRVYQFLCEHKRDFSLADVVLSLAQKRPTKAIAFSMDVKKHFCFLERGSFKTRRIAQA